MGGNEGIHQVGVREGIYRVGGREGIHLKVFAGWVTKLATKVTAGSGLLKCHRLIHSDSVPCRMGALKISVGMGVSNNLNSSSPINFRS